jgi:peroxiredoxin
MTPRISSGDRLPQAILGKLLNGVVQHVMLHEHIAGARAVIVGVPGAFTPVCTCEHIPDLLSNVSRLRASGIDSIICVAPNDPWALEAWAGCVDPEGKLEFLSDGNLSLARALGVSMVDSENMLGETSARYMMTVSKGVVRRLSVEPQMSKLTCTRGADVVLID